METRGLTPKQKRTKNHGETEQTTYRQTWHRKEGRHSLKHTTSDVKGMSKLGQAISHLVCFSKGMAVTDGIGMPDNLFDLMHDGIGRVARGASIKQETKSKLGIGLHYDIAVSPSPNKAYTVEDCP